MKENRIKEKVVKQEASARKRSGSRLPRGLVSVLNGSFLAKENVLRNMPFILFIAGLMLCYIAYGYWTERTVRSLDRTNAELKEMRSEYITVRSHLEQAEQQSQVAADIQGLGLEESRVPPHRLTVDEDLIEEPAR